MTAEQKVRFLTSQAELIERELGTNSSSFHSFKIISYFNYIHTKKTALSKGESRKALAEKRQLEKTIRDMKKEANEEESNAEEIARNMTRQYKCMQENLLKQITEAHQTIDKLKKELERSKRNVKDTEDHMRKMLDEKDRTIANQKLQMEEMSSEFAEMLKETLETMRSRIEVSDSSSKRSGSGVVSGVK